MTCTSSVTVKAHYSCSLHASQVKIILSWLSRQGGIYKSSKRKKVLAQSQHGFVDMPKFKRTTLLIHMPKSQPLKLHSFLQIKSLISLSDAKAAIKKRTLRLWQKSWTNNNTGRHLYDLQPMVSRKAYWSLYRRKAESKVNRLKMGHSLLKLLNYLMLHLKHQSQIEL